MISFSTRTNILFWTHLVRGFGSISLKDCQPHALEHSHEWWTHW